MISSSEFFKKSFLHPEEEPQSADCVGISPWFQSSQSNIRKEIHTSELKPLRNRRAKPKHSSTILQSCQPTHRVVLPSIDSSMNRQNREKRKRRATEPTPQLFVERYLNWVKNGHGYRIKYSLVRRFEDEHNFIAGGGRISCNQSPLDTIQQQFCFVNSRRNFVRAPKPRKSQLHEQSRESRELLGRRIHGLQH